jgi:hypothetical protein
VRPAVRGPRLYGAHGSCPGFCLTGSS